jgi:putative ABC transport system permease protein
VFKIALKSTLARRFRLLSTALSVMLGIAFLAGTLVFTDTIKRTFDDLFADVYQGTDAYVRPALKTEDDFGNEYRGRFSDSVLPTVAAVDGVAQADGFVQSYAQIIDKKGDPIGDPTQAPTFGMNFLTGAVSPWRLVDGAAPVDGTQVAIDKESASKGHFHVGDQLEVVASGGTKTFTLAGIVKFGTADSPGGASAALFDLQTAESFLGQPGQVDAILAAAQPGISEQELTDRVAAAIPKDQGLEVITGTQVTKESQDQIEENLSFFNTFLLIFAGIGLFVGSFSIYNTFQIIVTQRTREMALFRAIGASRKQVLASLIVEALAIGFIASVVGIALGVVVAFLLKGMLAALGIDIPAGGVVFKSRTAIVGLVVGMVVTVFSSVFPSLRASRIPPIAAMRDVAVDRSASRKRFVAGFLVTGAGVAALLGGLAAANIKAVGFGVGAIFIGVFVLGPLIAKPLSAFLGAPLPKLRGIAGSLAKENAKRSPKRTARTASALMIGAALVTGITVLAASFKGTIRDAYGKQFTGDAVVDTKSFGFGGLPTEITGKVQQLPEVAAAASYRVGIAKINGDDRTYAAIDPQQASKVIDLKPISGQVTDLTDDGVILSKKRAEDLHLAVGGTLEMTLQNAQTKTLTVQAIVDKTDALQGAGQIITQSLHEQSGTDQFDLAIYIKYADGVSGPTALAAIKTVTDQYPTATLRDREDFIDHQAAQINTFVNLMYGLLMLAVIIAVASISNTLSLSIYERTREIGLVRAVGSTRAQTRSTVRWESVLVALIGTVLGIVIGVFFGYSIIAALDDEGAVFKLPVGALILIIILAFLAGTVAAIRPARRAAKLDILTAIATD